MNNADGAGWVPQGFLLMQKREMQLHSKSNKEDGMAVPEDLGSGSFPSCVSPKAAMVSSARIQARCLQQGDCKAITRGNQLRSKFIWLRLSTH